MLNDPNAIESARRAASALSGFGNDGLQALLAALTNQQATTQCKLDVALQVRELGTNASAAIPDMQHLLTDPNLTVRRLATNALTAIDPKAPERAGR